ncbi:hypothetical protein [Clostridium sp. DL1XJH146]
MNGYRDEFDDYEMLPMPTMPVFFPTPMEFLDESGFEEVKNGNLDLEDTEEYNRNFNRQKKKNKKDKDYDYNNKDYYNKDYYNRDVRRILRKIETYNPGIFRYLAMYGVPYDAARKIVRRIIRLTLMYYDD